jgi:hypothetical protein
MTTGRLNVSLALMLWASIGLVEDVYATTIFPTYPVTLSSRDRREIVQSACKRSKSPVPETFTARRFATRDSTMIDVFVRCAPHRLIQQREVRTTSWCSNATRRWLCKDEGEFVEVVDGERIVHVRFSSDSELQPSIDVVRYLLGVRSFDGFDIRDRIDGQSCLVSRDPVGAWRAECGSLTIMVAGDCKQGTCAYRAFGSVTGAIQ